MWELLRIPQIMDSLGDGREQLPDSDSEGSKSMVMMSRSIEHCCQVFHRVIIHHFELTSMISFL